MYKFCEMVRTDTMKIIEPMRYSAKERKNSQRVHAGNGAESDPKLLILPYAHYV